MKNIIHIIVLILTIVFFNSSVSQGTLPPDRLMNGLNESLQSLERRIDRISTRHKIAERLLFYNPTLSGLYAGYISDVVMHYSSVRGLDPYIVAGVIVIESSADPRAKSNKGTKGVKQPLPVTARSLGYNGKNLFHPEDNIQYGTKYLAGMVKKYGYEKGIKTYFCGETNKRCLETKAVNKYYRNIVEERNHIKNLKFREDIL